MQTFEAPQELTSRPRQTRWSPAGYGFIGVSMILMMGGVLAGLYLERDGNTPAKEQRLLKEDGQDAEGRVTSRYRSTRSEQGMVNYRFEVDGRPYFGGREIPLRAMEQLPVGSPIMVRYLPSDPILSHPRDWTEPAPLNPGPLIFGAVLAAAGLAFLAVPWKERKLLRGGCPAQAVVMGIGRGRYGSVYIHFQFALPDGSRQKGHSGAVYSFPTPGSLVWVLYDPNRPKRNSMYPMEKVRLARS